jgi:hypothetical protein
MKITAEPEVLTPEQELNRIQYNRALNRRRFLTGLGATGLAAGAAIVAGCGSSGMKSSVPPVMAGSPQPSDVLNFALNLEYLEASFYLYATTGTGLSSTDMGSGAGTVTGGAQVTNFSPAVANIAAQIAADEQTHVELLRTALASAAVPMPNINLGALGTINNQTLFLQVARAFEDTGVSAYIGAAQYLVSSVPDLTYAAQILAVEAYHASNIRFNIIQMGLTSAATDSMDVPPTTSAYFCEKGALAIERTPQQVLNIVYANTSTGVTSGGFYPNGMNGTIIST